MRPAPAAILVGTLCVSWLWGCTGEDQPAATDEAPVAPAPPAAAPTPPVAGTTESCELALFYRQELEKLRNRFTEAHPEVALTRRLAEMAEADCASSAASSGPKSGDWVEEDGLVTCDGYLTRRDDEDYCAAEVPDEWVPFEYDGEIYFLQPLTGNAGREPGAQSTP